MSALPERDVERVRTWCAGAVSDDVREQMRIEVDVADRHLTLFECRPPWDPAFGSEWTRQPIARLRFTAGTGLWSLYWADSNDRFRAYEQVKPTAQINVLLNALDRDPDCVFWG